MVAGTVLVTGANRGLGLGVVKELLRWPKPPQVLIATCRDPSKAEELSDLAKEHSNLQIVQLELKNRATFLNFAEKVGELVGDRGLNLLYNNAGIFSSEPFGKITFEAMMEAYEVNTVCPLLLIQNLLPLLRKASKMCESNTLSVKRAAIINVSSGLGSIEDTETSGKHVYRCSKAAQNMMTKCLSVDLAPDNILCACVCPGWVATDMGGANADLTVEQSCSAMVKTLSSLDDSHQGAFVQYDGKSLRW